MEQMTIRQAGQRVLYPSYITVPPKGEEGRMQRINLHMEDLTGNAYTTNPTNATNPTDATSCHHRLPFIEANTKPTTVEELKDTCVVPVFSKDNELTISHQEFIEAVLDAAGDVFGNGSVSLPSVRVSHPIKGRIPEAVHKPVSELLDSDRTVFYERMMFCADIPSVRMEVGGNMLTLQIGGVRAYNEQNLGTRKSPEKFKIFIGFSNMVCCNLCVSSDGYIGNLKVMNVEGLRKAACSLFRTYDMDSHVRLMKTLERFRLTESQFAQFLGRCRMYQYLPQEKRKSLPEMLMTDTQVGMVARSYYTDENFAGEEEGLSLWKCYNLLTGANKSSYIDDFLGRAENAMELSVGLRRALEGDETYSWFLN